MALHNFIIICLLAIIFVNSYSDGKSYEHGQLDESETRKLHTVDLGGYMLIGAVANEGKTNGGGVIVDHVHRIFHHCMNSQK